MYEIKSNLDVWNICNNVPVRILSIRFDTTKELNLNASGNERRYYVVSIYDGFIFLVTTYNGYFDDNISSFAV